jgi:transposase, IS6 family
VLSIRKGKTIDFYLNKTRDHKDAKRLLKKALRSFHISTPRVITVDKNLTYPVTMEELKKEKKMPVGIQSKAIEIS